MANVPAIPSLPSLLTTASGIGGPSATGAPHEKAVELAREFESLMLLHMMRQMRQTLTSLGGNEEGKAFGGDLSAMTDAIDAELARHLSKGGGFGLSRYLSGAMASRAGEHDESAERGTNIAPATGVEPLHAVETPAPHDHSEHGHEVEGIEPRLDYAGTVTSRFGWRRDPLAHTPRFHAGVDIRAAYGQEVPAAGDGRVIFAGEQRGYGTTVVVQHGAGLQTRYAHLSALGVREGDQVIDGQTIGRVGQSGRATGPHLHFELTRDGQRIDPSEILDASRPRLSAAAEFKKVQVVADYTGGRPSGLDIDDVGSKP
jgi:murein DD-endopeptidase MepM/ murein hydrolase activator NlpD